MRVISFSSYQDEATHTSVVASEFRNMICVRVHAAENICIAIPLHAQLRTPKCASILAPPCPHAWLFLDGEQRERENHIVPRLICRTRMSVSLVQSREIRHVKMVARLLCVFCLLESSWKMRTTSIASCQSRADGTCGFPFFLCSHLGLPCLNYYAHDVCRIILPEHFEDACSIFVNDTYQALSVCRAQRQFKKGPAGDKVSIPQHIHPLTRLCVYHSHTLKRSLTRMVCDADDAIPSRRTRRPNKQES